MERPSPEPRPVDDDDADVDEDEDEEEVAAVRPAGSARTRGAPLTRAQISGAHSTETTSIAVPAQKRLKSGCTCGCDLPYLALSALFGALLLGVCFGKS